MRKKEQLRRYSMPVGRSFTGKRIEWHSVVEVEVRKQKMFHFYRFQYLIIVWMDISLYILTPENLSHYPISAPNLHYISPPILRAFLVVGVSKSQGCLGMRYFIHFHNICFVDPRLQGPFFVCYRSSRRSFHSNFPSCLFRAFLFWYLLFDIPATHGSIDCW